MSTPPRGANDPLVSWGGDDHWSRPCHVTKQYECGGFIKTINSIRNISPDTHVKLQSLFFMTLSYATPVEEGINVWQIQLSAQVRSLDNYKPALFTQPPCFHYYIELILELEMKCHIFRRAFMYPSQVHHCSVLTVWKVMLPPCSSDQFVPL